MNLLTRKRIYQIQKYFLSFVVFFLMAWNVPVWSEAESPLPLPKAEGSKSFDLEISQINSLAIKEYQQGLFNNAAEHFKKALTLAQQLRDPSQGILYFNLSLSLHKSGNHEKATKQFYSARRFARGNPKILESELLKMHECGFNPSISCEKKVPLSMNIEGSH
jgi:tetratricopeptide (TPR) repeat protein